ncbi:MAG: hypothetical protein EXS15_06625 [Phycisphaerales bacterium]|nr:hypothetical protein [Phycisphaerales bacterium]
MDDPFAVLGFRRQFEINPQEILMAQAAALAHCHPDRQSAGVARETAVGESARVNAAARVLLDRMSCIEALIGLGDPLGERVVLAPMQLAALMEQRECMEACATADNADALGCTEWIERERQRIIELLRTGLSSECTDWRAIRADAAYLRAVNRLSDDWARMRLDTQKGSS